MTLLPQTLLPQTLLPRILLPQTLWAAEASSPNEKPESLEDQLQTLKVEVLQLNRELTQLERSLLYPNTEFALFLSLDIGTPVRLVDAKVILDNQPIRYHYYTDAEFAALQKGAIQRLYDGNIISGPHQVTVEVSGFLPDGREYRKTQSHHFEKKEDRKWLELKLLDPLQQHPQPFDLKDWVL